MLFPACLGIIWSVRFALPQGSWVSASSPRGAQMPGSWEMAGCACPGLTSSPFAMPSHIGTPCKDTFNAGAKPAASGSRLRTLGSLLLAAVRAGGRGRLGRHVDR